MTGPPGPGTRADNEANRGDPVMTSHMKDRKPWVLAAVTGVRPLIIALVAVWGLGYGAVPVAAQSWMAQAMPANVEGGLALFVSALQGSLAAGSAVGGIVYDAEGPGGVLIVAAVFAALGALTLLGRAGAAISAAPALKLPFAAIPRPLPRRKELLCQTRL